MSYPPFIQKFRESMFNEGQQHLTSKQYKLLRDKYKYFVLNIYNEHKDNKDAPGLIPYLQLFTRIFDILLTALLSGNEIEKPDIKNGTIRFGIKVKPID